MAACALMHLFRGIGTNGEVSTPWPDREAQGRLLDPGCENQADMIDMNHRG